MQGGLAAFGGATAQIAEPYAEVIKDINKLNLLMGVMHNRLNTWASQTIEAKNNSIVRDIELFQESGIRQIIHADDHSLVEKVHMEQRDNQPPFPPRSPQPGEGR